MVLATSKLICSLRRKQAQHTLRAASNTVQYLNKHRDQSGIQVSSVIIESEIQPLGNEQAIREAINQVMDLYQPLTRSGINGTSLC